MQLGQRYHRQIVPRTKPEQSEAPKKGKTPAKVGLEHMQRRPVGGQSRRLDLRRSQNQGPNAKVQVEQKKAKSEQPQQQNQQASPDAPLEHPGESPKLKFKHFHKRSKGERVRRKGTPAQAKLPAQQPQKEVVKELKVRSDFDQGLQRFLTDSAPVVLFRAQPSSNRGTKKKEESDRLLERFELEEETNPFSLISENSGSRGLLSLRNWKNNEPQLRSGNNTFGHHLDSLEFDWTKALESAEHFGPQLALFPVKVEQAPPSVPRGAVASYQTSGAAIAASFLGLLANPGE